MIKTCCSCILWLAVLAAAPGCNLLSPAPKPQWVTAEIPSASEQVLREVVMVSLQKTGFPVGSGVDPGARMVTTGWHESTHAFKGKGWREKATVEYAPSGNGQFGVRIRVQRETNESLRPLEPEYSKWKPAPDHPPSAQRVLQYMRSMLDRDFEVNDVPEPTFGGS